MQTPMQVSTQNFGLTDTWKIMRRYPCTACMLVTIWLMFAIELLTHALGSNVMLLRLGALPTNEITHREYWRLVTYALLHSGWWHIGLNTYVLLMAGPVVERTSSSRSTLAISIAGAVLGGAGILAAHRGGGASIELGASGALFALLGSGLVMIWQCSPAKSLATYRKFQTVLIVGLLISFLPGISMAAHLAGLATGVIFALALRQKSTGATANSRLTARYERRRLS